MNGVDEPLDSPQVTVDELLRIHARLAGDIIEINETTWGIHGVIAVDGDVLIAEFNRPEDARLALEHIAAVENGSAPPERDGSTEAIGIARWAPVSPLQRGESVRRDD